MTPADLAVYLVTDPELLGERSLVDVVMAAVEGGATVVQLRNKQASGRALFEAGRALRAVLAPRRIPLVVNDRADVAVAVGAEGLHLGQQDLPVREARAIVGPEVYIGLSLERLQDAERVDDAVDYVAASPVFGTPTKADCAPPLGLAGVRTLAAGGRPLVGIGGIHAGNAADVVRAGAQGVAVVSAILGAPDPCEAARALARAVEAGR